MHSQENLKFIQYTTDLGLPANYVLDIYQDHKGFIWFGFRAGGCCRYDGFSFKAFPVITPSGPQKIQTSVKCIVQDNKKRLWVGEISQYCLLLFDVKKEVFIDYFHKLNLPDSIKTISIKHMICDKDGFLWIGTEQNGIILFNPDTEETRLLNHDPENINTIPPGQSRYILEEKHNVFWIGTTKGLCRYNTINQKFTHYFHPQQSGIADISYLYKDLSDNIWIGIHNKGLYCYIEKDDFFKPIMQETVSQRLFLKNPGPILEDAKNRFWIGTPKGLGITNKEKTECWQYFHYENNQYSLNSNKVTCISPDKTGTIWIGTSEGVCRVRQQKFKTLKYSALKNSISDNRVQYIMEVQSKDIWLSTPSGINIYDKKKDKFTFFSEITRDKFGLSRGPVVTFEIPQQGVWIGTYKGGLNYYDYDTKSYAYYFHNPKKSNTLSHNSVFSLYADLNKLWVGTYGGGLDLFEMQTQVFRNFSHKETDTTTLPSNFIHRIHKDKNNKLWIGTENGIAVLDNEQKGIFKTVIESKSIGTGQKVGCFYFLNGNKGEYIWMATNVGLIRFHLKTNKIKLYTENDGLPTSKILSILEDNKKDLWLSTSNGLVRVRPDYNNPEKELEIKIYTKSDGLQGQEFLPSSSCQLHDGNMLFGGARGFNIFHPDSIKDNQNPPLLAFTGLEISNTPIKIGQEVNGQKILDKSIEYMDILVLNHKNNDFTIEFTALHFTQPEENMYAYTLQGFDSKWNYIGANKRKAHYMNLSSGKYKLKVKASNSDGIWNEEGISLPIKILPPWWQTVWFTSSIAALFVTLFFLVVKLRIYGLQKQKRKLEKIVEKRTLQLQDMNLVLEERQEELEQQTFDLQEANKHLKLNSKKIKEMAKKLHDADQSKLKLFANISHEFRTPLALILAPLEKYRNIGGNADWNKLRMNDNINLMYRNAKRLLRLVNEIIDFRKIDLGKKKINASNNNIIEFINEVVSAFKPLAEAKGIQLLVKIDELRVKNEEQSIQSKQLIIHHSSLITQFWFAPDIMEKILYNLISNAIKYTPEGGEINIQLTVRNEELIIENHNKQNEIPPLITHHSSLITHHSSLIIKITDTGIGIKPEYIDKIFDRFYRVETHGPASLYENQTDGTGIGLAYTKELVELHKGSIEVKSQPSKGVCFILKFPFDTTDKKNRKKTENNSYTNTSSKNKNEMFRFDYMKSMIKEEGTLQRHIDNTINTFSGSENEQDQVKNNKRPCVLIIEDNFDLRSFIKKELKLYYKVMEAENGQVGWEKVMQYYPDIVVSDIMMPEMDGIELCKNIKTNQDTSHIPVILLTAKSGEENTLHGLKIGADDYITKPFNMQLLLARINNVLEIRKRLREKFNTSPLETGHKVSAATNADEFFLSKATDIVKQNIKVPDFNNDQFIKLMGMSRAVLYRKIKALTNQSVSEFIRTIRLKIAAKILLEDSQSISEACYAVGFKHHENFSRYFSAHFGLTPTEFIKKNKKKK